MDRLKSKNFMYAATILGVLFSLVAFSMEFPPPPLTQDFGGSIKSGIYRMIIPESGLVLSQNEILRAEEIVISGPIETRGHELILDARRVEFIKGGKILGFTHEAQPTLSVGLPGNKGGQGCDNCEPADPFTIRANKGGAGGGGTSGGLGAAGVQGDLQPLQVRFFSASILGQPILTLKGQKGGKGGFGGKGGDGGNGGKGGKARATCFVWASYGPGQGGESGLRGQGGKGGTGGRGGQSIPLQFLTSQTLSSLKTDLIVTEQGEGGDGGDPGESGNGGSPGDGGDGDSAGCLFFSIQFGSGPGGHVNKKNPANLGRGEGGEVGQNIPNGLSIKDVSELELQRGDVLRSWFQFHWSRTLALLVQETLLLVSDLEFTRNQLAQFSARDDLLKRIILNSNRQKTLQLQDDWRNHFLQPLEAGDSGVHHIVDPLLRGLDLILSVSDLDEIKKNFDLALIQAESLLASRLDLALNECVRFNKTLSQHAQELLGATSHFDVPICRGVPDLTLPENIEKEIITVKSYIPAAPLGIEVKLTGEQPLPEHAYLPKTTWFLFDLASLFVKFVSFTTAFAEDFDIIFVNQKTISIKELQNVIPEARGRVDGSVVGYKQLDEKKIREDLAYFLHVQALLAGVKK